MNVIIVRDKDPLWEEYDNCRLCKCNLHDGTMFHIFPEGKFAVCTTCINFLSLNPLVPSWDKGYHIKKFTYQGYNMSRSMNWDELNQEPRLIIDERDGLEMKEDQSRKHAAEQISYKDIIKAMADITDEAFRPADAKIKSKLVEYNNSLTHRLRDLSEEKRKAKNRMRLEELAIRQYETEISTIEGMVATLKEIIFDDAKDVKK